MDLKNIRIEIKWTDLLLSLEACGGDLIVEEIDLPRNLNKVLFTARIHVKKGSHGYDNAKFFNNFSYKIFEEKILPRITTMITSYHKGMILSKSQYEWIVKY